MSRNITLDLIHWARKTPNAPALLFRDTMLDYRHLDLAVWQLAQHLHDRGIRRRQIVALTIGNEILLALSLLAVARLGAAGLSLARSMGALERVAVARQAGVVWLLADHEAAAIPDVQLLPLTANTATWNVQRIDYGILDESPSAPWQIIRGSGTTGEPKLLPVSHGQAATRFLGQVQASAILPEDRLAGLSSLEFSISKHRLGWALAAGACYVLPDYAKGLDDIRRLGVTLLGISVMHAEELLSDPPCDALDGVRAMWCAGSVVSNDLRARMHRQFGDRLWVDYGSNEAGHLALARSPEVFDTPSTVGRCLPGVELEIVDSDNRPLPTGTVGHIRVRGSGVIDGYLGDAASTRQAFRDGWYYPGDLGQLTADRQLIHRGRSDEMMIVNGINIYPEEIESVLRAYPGIADVAVVPLHSRVNQDIPVCAVVAQPGCQPVEAEMAVFVRERIGHRAPVRIVVLDALPRNEQGKLDRNGLAGTLLAKMPERPHPLRPATP